jgi:hypothetical protein
MGAVRPQPVGPCGHLVRFDGERKRVQHMLLGLRHGPILQHRNLSERYHAQHGAYAFAPEGALGTAFVHTLALPTGLSLSVIDVAPGFADANRFAAVVPVAVPSKREGQARIVAARLG